MKNIIGKTFFCLGGPQVKVISYTDRSMYILVEYLELPKNTQSYKSMWNNRRWTPVTKIGDQRVISRKSLWTHRRIKRRGS